ncbi:unnamed protein product [Phytophthora fragariaefolia]|uniref:Unnamed protein product n=1 Tax=Phytophthora fragariaefolia TaxID=1490495 RepID=A0A9W6YH20_9STRA|nr:unnamed protein product [Phytophthora fragariaefolia]
MTTSRILGLVLVWTIFALVTRLATAVANAQVQNEEAQDTTHNVRVGIIKLKDGSHSEELIVRLGNESDSVSSEGSPNILEITKPDLGNSATSEERFVASASWVQSLKAFIKDPVLFTKMFLTIRKFFNY